LSGGVNGDLEMKVASYQRWTRVSLDMPCLTTGKLTYNLGGYSKSVTYPKFYRCPYANQIPLPNHHVPYIKLYMNPSKRTISTRSLVVSNTTAFDWNQFKRVEDHVPKGFISWPQVIHYGTSLALAGAFIYTVLRLIAFSVGKSIFDLGNIRRKG
jgi:hypothetical protein